MRASVSCIGREHRRRKRDAEKCRGRHPLGPPRCHAFVPQDGYSVAPEVHARTNISCEAKGVLSPFTASRTAGPNLGLATSLEVSCGGKPQAAKFGGVRDLRRLRPIQNYGRWSGPWRVDCEAHRPSYGGGTCSRWYRALFESRVRDFSGFRFSKGNAGIVTLKL
jgi:hypothetical protein